MKRLMYAFMVMLSLTSLACAQSATTISAQSEPMALWSGAAPGEKGGIGAEYNKSEAENRIRLTNVTQPTITVYRPAPEKDTGAAVLLCPGGAYKHLAMDIEGESVRAWLNSIGMTAVLLKYRVPEREGREKHAAPLQDAQRAMGLIRLHASEWKIDPNRLGVIGFSAGGHLSAVLSNTFEQRTYDAVDEADKQSCRPDFAMLIYPFYLTPDDDHAKLSPELRVSEKTPPTFLVMTEDDRVWYAFTYALALKEAEVPAELHIYARGGHGYGIGKDGGPVATWPKRAEEWLGAGQWLKAR